MTTALIPEVIQPGVLYAPSANNQFSVETAGLPNTDDALEIDGTAGVFRAYQPAIAGSHYVTNPASPFCILYWFKCGSAASGSQSTTLTNSQLHMGVMDPAPAANGINAANNASTTGFSWALSQPNNVQPGPFTVHRAVGATSRSTTYGAARGTTYKGFAHRWPGTTAPNTVDMQLNSLGTNAAGTVGTPGALTSPYFGLGSFPLTGSFSSGQSLIHYAKIALFDYYVSDTELLDLYDSMINGPPSP